MEPKKFKSSSKKVERTVGFLKILNTRAMGLKLLEGSSKGQGGYLNAFLVLRLVSPGKKGENGSDEGKLVKKWKTFVVKSSSDPVWLNHEFSILLREIDLQLYFQVLNSGKKKTLIGECKQALKEVIPDLNERTLKTIVLELQKGIGKVQFTVSFIPESERNRTMVLNDDSDYFDSFNTDKEVSMESFLSSLVSPSLNLSNQLSDSSDSYSEDVKSIQNGKPSATLPLFVDESVPKQDPTGVDIDDMEVYVSDKILDVRMDYAVFFQIYELKDILVESQSKMGIICVINLDKQWRKTPIISSAHQKIIFLEGSSWQLESKDIAQELVLYVLSVDSNMNRIIPMFRTALPVQLLREDVSPFWVDLEKSEYHFATGSLRVKTGWVKENQVFYVMIKEGNYLDFPRTSAFLCQVVVSCGSTREKTDFVHCENGYAKWNALLKFNIDSRTVINISAWKREGSALEKKFQKVFLGQFSISPNLMLVDDEFSLQPSEDELFIFKSEEVLVQKSYASARVTAELKTQLVFSIDFYDSILQIFRNDLISLLRIMRTTTMKLDDRLEVAQNLLHVYDSMHSVQVLIDQMINEELRLCSSTDTLFRGNTLYTKAIDLYMRSIGNDYLIKTIKPVIEKIIQNSITPCEVNPERVIKDELRKNFKELVYFVKMLLDAIYSSVDQCPGVLRSLIYSLRHKVQEKFKEENDVKYIVVSAFFFLRFMGPTFMSPKSYNIVTETPNYVVCTALGNIAKTVQRIANMNKFKEPTSQSILKLEHFIEIEKENMRSFIDSIAIPVVDMNIILQYIDIRKAISALVAHFEGSIDVLTRIAESDNNPEIQKGMHVDSSQARVAKKILRILEAMKEKKNNCLEVHKLQAQKRRFEEKGRIFVYVRDGDQDCLQVHQILEKFKEIEYITISITQFPDRLSEMEKLTGKSTVPQVLFNDKPIGGVRELEDMAQKGMLELELYRTLNSVPPAIPTIPNSVLQILNKLRSRKRNLLARHLYYEIKFPKENAFKLQKIMIKLKTYNRSWKGEALIDWIFKHLACRTIEQATEKASVLIQEYYAYPRLKTLTKRAMDPKGLYRFYSDKEPNTVNMERRYMEYARNPIEVSIELQKQFIELSKKYDLTTFTSTFTLLSQEMDEIVRSPIYMGISDTAIELQKVSLDELSNDEKKVFFLNIYNSLAIHAIIHHFVVHYEDKSTKFTADQKFSIFNEYCYSIGGLHFTLNAIEHGILRGNRPAPITIMAQNARRDKYLEEDSHLTAFSLVELDMRTHFAILNGPRATPPIRCFTMENLEQSLNLATETFISSDLQITNDTVEISPIFIIYNSDFGPDAEKLRFLSKYVPDNHPLQNLLQSENIKINYNKFDWDTYEREYSLEEEEDIEVHKAVLSTDEGEQFSLNMDFFSSKGVNEEITCLEDMICLGNDQEARPKTKRKKKIPEAKIVDFINKEIRDATDKSLKKAPKIRVNFMNRLKFLGTLFPNKNLLINEIDSAIQMVWNSLNEEFHNLIDLLIDDLTLFNDITDQLKASDTSTLETESEDTSTPKEDVKEKIIVKDIIIVEESKDFKTPKKELEVMKEETITTPITTSSEPLKVTKTPQPSSVKPIDIPRTPSSGKIAYQSKSSKTPRKHTPSEKTEKSSKPSKSPRTSEKTPLEKQSHTGSRKVARTTSKKGLTTSKTEKTPYKANSENSKKKEKSEGVRKSPSTASKMPRVTPRSLSDKSPEIRALDATNTTPDPTSTEGSKNTPSLNTSMNEKNEPNTEKSQLQQTQPLSLAQTQVIIEKQTQVQQTQPSPSQPSQSKAKKYTIAESVYDLKDYEKGEYIDGPKFCSTFCFQYNNNYATLEQSNFTLIRHRMKYFMGMLEVFTVHLQDIFTENVIAAMTNLYNLVKSTKDTLHTLLAYLEGHIGFCRSVLENVHLDSFSEKSVKIALYHQKHSSSLDNLFGTDVVPAFPFKFPYFVELKDAVAEVTNMDEYTRLKASYSRVLQTIQQMEMAVPKKWPQILPNLSTYNGKPPLRVGTKEDFGMILGCYFEFIQRMERLKTNWTFSLRLSYQFLENPIPPVFVPKDLPPDTPTSETGEKTRHIHEFSLPPLASSTTEFDLEGSRSEKKGLKISRSKSEAELKVKKRTIEKSTGKLQNSTDALHSPTKSTRLTPFRQNKQQQEQRFLTNPKKPTGSPRSPRHV